MKPGSKLKSTVCDTEVMVIRGAADAVVECGGAPMAEQAPAERRPINPGFAQGTRIGKRYVDADGKIELFDERKLAFHLLLRRSIIRLRSGVDRRRSNAKDRGGLCRHGRDACHDY